MESDLHHLLEVSSARHSHLCPRQVLGVRIGMAGVSALGLEVPRHDKRLVVILETDGCFADGVEAATGCMLGHRTLRIEDYGKIAATFVDVKTEQALRVAPWPDVRQKASLYAPSEPRRYFAQLQAYQTMPEAELLHIQPVFLHISIKRIVSRAGVRVNCEACREEIINEREILLHGRILCRTCAQGGYFHPAQEFPAAFRMCQHAMK
jgi:formylmethanofuran dehydrogenase subunit E